MRATWTSLSAVLVAQVCFVACSTQSDPGKSTSQNLTEVGGLCAQSAECAEGARCFEGKCVVELCDDSSPCSEGGACIDGACCYGEDDCSPCDSEDC